MTCNTLYSKKLDLTVFQSCLRTGPDELYDSIKEAVMKGWIREGSRVLSISNGDRKISLDEKLQLLKRVQENLDIFTKTRKAVVSNDPATVAHSMLISKFAFLPANLAIFSTVEAALHWQGLDIEAVFDELPEIRQFGEYLLRSRCA